MMKKIQKHASELMPKSEEAVNILKKRAEQFAQSETNELENHGISFVRFKVNQNEHYGVPYKNVQEVLNNISITKPPLVPDYIAGVINWRGSVITIIDLIQFFHPYRALSKFAAANELYKVQEDMDSPPRYYSEPTKNFIIVIRAQDITLGLIVQSVEGGEMYQLNQLSKPLSTHNVAKSEYILGLHHSITAIINVEVFISGLVQEIKSSLFKIGDVYGVS